MQGDVGSLRDFAMFKVEILYLVLQLDVQTPDERRALHM